MEKVITGTASPTKRKSLMKINMELKIAEYRWERDRGLARKSGDGQIMRWGVGI